MLNTTSKLKIHAQDTIQWLKREEEHTQVVQESGVQRNSSPHLSVHIVHQNKGMPFYNRAPKTHLGFVLTSSAVVILLYLAICTTASCEPSLAPPWASQLASPLFLAPLLPLSMLHLALPSFLKLLDSRILSPLLRCDLYLFLQSPLAESLSGGADQSSSSSSTSIFTGGVDQCRLSLCPQYTCLV